MTNLPQIPLQPKAVLLKEGHSLSLLRARFRKCDSSYRVIYEVYSLACRRSFGGINYRVFDPVRVYRECYRDRMLSLWMVVSWTAMLQNGR